VTKPVLITVDDDAQVLRAIERDLRKRYSETYRVMRADSGGTGLDVLRQLQLRNEPVALMLVDQRMPGMSGVEFLEKAITFFPAAKRALLTAYADTEAAIQAINQVHINNYLLKPWDPPEQNLYPVVDDLLGDWLSEFLPDFRVFVCWALDGLPSRIRCVISLREITSLTSGWTWNDGMRMRTFAALAKLQGSTKMRNFRSSSSRMVPSSFGQTRPIWLPSWALVPVHELRSTIS